MRVRQRNGRWVSSVESIGAASRAQCPGGRSPTESGHYASPACLRNWESTVINKSILVLEENSVVHGLIASALDVDGLTLHHEFNPAKYVDRARNLKPDLILVSNADQFNNYSICRQLKTGPGGGTPLVLLANYRDALDAARLRDLQVDGVVRKPFEASDLQEQVSRHLHLPDLVGLEQDHLNSFPKVVDLRSILQDPDQIIGIRDRNSGALRGLKSCLLLFIPPLNPQCDIVDSPVVRLIESQPFIVKGMIDLDGTPPAA